MERKIINPLNNPVNASITVPADKSISHRAVMISSLAKGTSFIYNFLEADDCIRTVNAFKAMGVKIFKKDGCMVIKGNGLQGLQKPKGCLYMGNSGTTMRLISGVLAAQKFDTVLTGDESLSHRPMKRIIEPLLLMGAKINSKNDSGYAPLHISGMKLHGIDYTLPVASAQVKSAIFLAGLYAKGETVIREEIESRDHTERMLKFFRVSIVKKGLVTRLSSIKELKCQKIYVPSDISSASFFFALAALIKDSKIQIKDVSINPTRTGILHVLKKMGIKIILQNKKISNNEPRADITVLHSKIKPFKITRQNIPYLIDEIPILAVLGCFAKGISIVEGASELRVKESDRIKSMVLNLAKMGAKIIEKKDGFIIEGVGRLKGAKLDSFDDHRIAMSLSIAALASDTPSVINNTECVAISFPNFYYTIERLCKR